MDKLFVADYDSQQIFIAHSDGYTFANSFLAPLPLEGIDSPVGVDFDPRSNMIYWTDDKLHTINRATLDGSTQEVVVQVAANVGCE